jgi:hypothetical protein
MPRPALAALTASEAAQGLCCAPQTGRRLLQSGRLPVRRHGREWIVWRLPEEGGGRRGGQSVPRDAATMPEAPRQCIGIAGERLTTVDKPAAGIPPCRGQAFRPWRTSRSLRVTLAIGRTPPTPGWAPHVRGAAVLLAHGTTLVVGSATAPAGFPRLSPAFETPV